MDNNKYLSQDSIEKVFFDLGLENKLRTPYSGPDDYAAGYKKCSLFIDAPVTYSSDSITHNREK